MNRYPTELFAYRTVEEAVAGTPTVASRVMRSAASDVAEAAVESGLYVAIDIFYRGRFTERVVAAADKTWLLCGAWVGPALYCTNPTGHSGGHEA